jgi:hypothetical protein
MAAAPGDGIDWFQVPVVVLGYVTSKGGIISIPKGIK